MCITALPEHLNSKEEIESAFKDDDQFGITGLGGLYRRFKKWTKAQMAFGPRDIHWYHRWRKLPIVLLVIFGRGESRWENDLFALRSVNSAAFLYWPEGFYLSRVQYWCDWHIQICWPLFFCMHFKYGRTGIFTFYMGAKRDADMVYWFPAIYIGLGHK